MLRGAARGARAATMPTGMKAQRVRVYARCRPAGVSTDGSGATFLTEAAAGQTCIAAKECDPAAGVVTVVKDGEGKQFKLDGYLPPESTQVDVYERVAAHIVRDVLQGYNGTIFAYGQTGTGKTHTMLGPQWDPERDFGAGAATEAEVAAEGGESKKDADGEDGEAAVARSAAAGPVMSERTKGIIPRSLDDLFARVAGDTEHRYLVTLSYVQIYCELVHDLLAGDAGSPLSLREDASGGVYVDGASAVRVTSTRECMMLVREGNQNRATASTRMNAHSSRSHAVLYVTVERRSREVPSDDALGTKGGAGGKRGSSDAEAQMVTGTLFLVDLAGSERAKKSGVTGMRLNELKAINLSLSSLGNCIAALAEKKKHVPYRDSKLTRLLQGSLGGNAKTALVVNIAPTADDVGETLSTLAFGQRARKVAVRATINMRVDYKSMYEAMRLRADKDDDKTTELNMVIQRLQREVDTLKGKLSAVEAEREAAQAELRAAAASFATSIESVEKGVDLGGGGAAAVIERVNRRWEEEIERLKKVHAAEVATLKERMEKSVMSQQLVAEEAATKASSFEREAYDLKDETTEALEQYNKAMEQMFEMDKEHTRRTSELVAEVDEMRAVAVKSAEELAKSNERIANAERAMAEVMGRIKTEYVSRKQVEEMETLYDEAIQKLVKRVDVLEGGRSDAADEAPPVPVNPRATHGARGGMTYTVDSSDPRRAPAAAARRSGAVRAPRVGGTSGSTGGRAGASGPADSGGRSFVLRSTSERSMGGTSGGGSQRETQQSRERKQRMANIPGVAPHLAIRASKRTGSSGSRGSRGSSGPPSSEGRRAAPASERPPAPRAVADDDDDLDVEASRALLANLISGGARSGASMKAPSSRLNAYQ